MPMLQLPRSCTGSQNRSQHILLTLLVQVSEGSTHEASKLSDKIIAACTIAEDRSEAAL